LYNMLEVDRYAHYALEKSWGVGDAGRSTVDARHARFGAE
jgi:hypothetical protein